MSTPSAGICTKALLAKLSISQCAFRRLDRQVTDEVSTNKAASRDAGRYNKALIDPKALEPIQKIVTAARLYHYSVTLPWGDNETRVLSAMEYFNYVKKIGTFQSDFLSAVNLFISQYDSVHIPASRARLGSMFKWEDFPEVSQLPRKFAMSLDMFPIPSAGDLRVEINEAELARIKADIETKTKDFTQEAMKDLWQRLHTAVSRMAERLQDDDGTGKRKGKDGAKIFHDTLVSNLTDLVDLLPRMNITGDPELEKMRREVQDKLCQEDPKTLRSNAEARRTVQKSATELAEQLAAYF